MVTLEKDKSGYSAGITQCLRIYSPNITATKNINDTINKTEFGKISRIYKPVIFASSTFYFNEKMKLDAGLRLSGGLTNKANFLVIEPRLRFTFNQEGSISPHINYVRLSQFDHSVEG
jgi:hypothetical protein